MSEQSHPMYGGGGIASPPANLLTLVYENMTDGVVICEENGRILYANPAMGLILGRPLEELGGSFLGELIPSELEHRGDFRRESTSTVEVSVLLPDGRTRSLVSRSFSIRSAPPIVVSLYRDVTRRRRTQIRLVESERRFRAIVESIPVPVLICHAEDHKILFCNDRVEELFQVRADDLMGEKSTRLFVDMGDHESLVRRLGKSGVVRGREIRTRRRDGSMVWTSITSEKLHFGGELAYLLSFLDISERKRAERRVRDSENRYRQAITQANAVAYELEHQSKKYTFLSENVQQLTGYSAEELTPPLFWNLIQETELHGEYKGMDVLQAVQHAQRTGSKWKADYLIRARDGQLRWLSDSSIPIRKSEGSGGYMSLGILQDISDRKNAEEAVRDTQRRMHQSQKLEALGRLAGSIAHDFSNVLTGISGYCGLCLDRIGNREYVEKNLKEILETVDHASGLIQQLLAFSRNVPLEPETLDLNEVTKDIAKLIRRVIGDETTVFLDTCREPVRVWADKGQIEQILMNLAVNARDAMPNGGELTIRTGFVRISEKDPRRSGGLGPGRYVELVVEDNGQGIDPEVLPKIFDPFFSTKEGRKGTGLGLSTVYGIVSQSGGVIVPESSPGKGSIFRILLPEAKPEDPDATQAEPVRSDPPARGNVSPSERTILIVEDEKSVRMATTAVLSRAGYRTLDAADAEGALVYLRDPERQIDLLLTDLVMPGMGGWALAEQAVAMRPGCQVVAMSGYLDELSFPARDCVGSYLRKPFSPKQLKEAVACAFETETKAE